MTTVTLKTQHLAAALLCAAAKDRRYYLNGVLVRLTADGRVLLLATDGYKVFVGLADKGMPDREKPLDIIIPSATVAAACKAKVPQLQLQDLPDGRYALGDTPFTPIDGVFPNVSWAIPSAPSGIMSQFSPDTLSLCNKALRIWSGAGAGHIYHFIHNDTRPGLMTAETAHIAIAPFTGPSAPFPTFSAS